LNLKKKLLTSVAINVGRKYKEALASFGTQAFSVETNLIKHFKNSSLS
jgi:hypothetical protein